MVTVLVSMMTGLEVCSFNEDSEAEDIVRAIKGMRTGERLIHDLKEVLCEKGSHRPVEDSGNHADLDVLGGGV